MARPPLSLGHHGTIKVTKDGDQWVGHDGAERSTTLRLSAVALGSHRWTALRATSRATAGVEA
jgi:hypothetical protein